MKRFCRKHLGIENTIFGMVFYKSHKLFFVAVICSTRLISQDDFNAFPLRLYIQNFSSMQVKQCSVKADFIEMVGRSL